MSRGVDPQPIKDNELNEIKNLKKKVDYLKDQLDDHEDHHSHESEDDDDDEEVEEIKPKKKNIKTQRAGISAEVYGQWNKKGDFKPKVVEKSLETRNKLKKRLL